MVDIGEGILGIAASLHNLVAEGIAAISNIEEDDFDLAKILALFFDSVAHFACDLQGKPLYVATSVILEIYSCNLDIIILCAGKFLDEYQVKAKFAHIRKKGKEFVIIFIVLAEIEMIVLSVGLMSMVLN